ncbi:MAG: PAS domain S-box protein [Thermoanaerobaculaceae bacterium]|nr:PAS domain S-box protein [Thermoanaerobaculaceae bacterium]
MATAGDRLTPTRARVLFAVVAILAVAGGALVLRQTRGSVWREKYGDLASIGRIKAEAIAAWRAERCNHAAELAESPFFRRAAAGLLTAPAAPGMREEMVVRLDVARRLYSDASVFLAAPEGRVLASAGATPVVDAATLAELRRAVADGRPFLGDFFRPGGAGPPVLDAVAAVADGNARAVLVVRIDPTRYLDPLIQRWPVSSASAETLLVQRRGGDVLFLNEPRFRPGAALTLRQPLSRTTLPAAQAVLGRTGPFEGVDYRGVAVLADLRPVPGSPWFIVAKVDRAEILAGLRQETVAVVAAVLGLVLLSGLGVGYVYKARGKRVLQRLLAAERQTLEAHERLAATLRGIGDAVIATDADGRVQVMNQVAETLTGWSEAEALGKPLDEVFRIVNERTRAVVESPVARVLRENRVVGLANHTLLLARDGREVPIADSGAPILDSAGRLVGVVLVVRDQTEERRANRALEASEQRFTLFMRHLPAVAVIRDTQGRYVYMNDAWESAMGLRREDYLGKSPFDCFPRADAERLVADDRLLAESGRTVAMEVELHHASGPRWWLVNRFALRGTDGRPTHVAALYVDITERKRAEKAVKETEELYRDLVENASDFICTHDLRGVLLSVNGAAARSVGFAPEDLVGRDLRDLLLPDERHAFDAYVEAIARDGVAAGVLKLTTRAGVARFWEYRNTLRVEGVAEPVVRGMARDVTEQILAKRELKASQEKYRAILANMEESYYEADLAGNLTFFNDSLCRLLGYSREQLLGMNDRQFMDPDQADKVYRAFNTVYRTGEATRGLDWEVIRRDGSRRFIEASVSLTRDGSDRPAGFRGLIRDVTDHKRAEEERAKLEEHLRQAQKLESIGRLAGGVAHDFNNMLNIITIYAELALGKLGKGDPLRRDLEEILKAAGRSADLTRQLLAFARKQQVTPRVLDLNATLAEMGKMLIRLIGEDISFTFKPSEGLWPVKIDPVQVDQILANLAVNARDAMDGPGRVVVETGNATLDEGYRDTHGFAQGGDYVVLAFSDTGRGMDAETRAQAFEPFFTTKGQLGTGLGLATVYGIVKQNGGLINVYSEPGRGTTFKIYLPRWTGEGQPAPTAREALGPRGSETVLIAEDEEAILRLAERILASHGYRVLTAAAPGDALRLAERYGEPIHLLLTDVVMPVMNGRELCERLRTSRAALRVLYMSGYTADVIANRGIVEDGVAFLQKPFTITGLLAAVRRALA